VTHTGSYNCIGYSVINILNIPNKNFSSTTLNISTNTIQYMIIRPTTETTLVFPKRTSITNLINLTGISGINSYITATNYLTDIPDEIKSLIPEEHLLELNTPTELYTRRFNLNGRTLTTVAISSSLSSFGPVLSSSSYIVTPNYLRNGYSIRHTVLPCRLTCQYYYRNRYNTNNLSDPFGMYPNGVIMKTNVNGEFIFMSHNDANLTNYPYTSNIIHIKINGLTFTVPETGSTYTIPIQYDSNTIKKYCGEIKITRPISTRNDCLRASLSYWNYNTMFTILYDTVSDNVNNPVLFNTSSWNNININLSYMRIDDGGSSTLRTYFANI
jgi:hypothetical protein